MSGSAAVRLDQRIALLEALVRVCDDPRRLAELAARSDDEDELVARVAAEWSLPATAARSVADLRIANLTGRRRRLLAEELDQLRRRRATIGAE